MLLLLVAGGEKLGIEAFCAVLEADGTEIDGDSLGILEPTTVVPLLKEHETLTAKGKQFSGISSVVYQ